MAKGFIPGRIIEFIQESLIMTNRMGLVPEYGLMELGMKDSGSMISKKEMVIISRLKEKLRQASGKTESVSNGLINLLLYNFVVKCILHFEKVVN